MNSDTKLFLDALFGGKPDGSKILIWALRGKEKTSRWAGDVAEALRAVEAASAEDGWNVFAGVCPAPKSYGKAQRAKMTEVVSLPGLWSDIDIGNLGHDAKAKNPNNEAEARKILDKLPIPPSLIVHTGGGIHAYWLFSEHWTFDDPKERESAAGLVQAWQRLISIHAATLGLTVDSTFDLARVLRIPGTSNWKDTEPRLCRIISEAGNRYNPEDIRGMIPPEAFQATKPKTIVNSQTGDLLFDPIASPPFEKFEALNAGEPRFAAAWLRKRPDLKDQSPSGYDLSLAQFAAYAQWTDQEIVNLMIAFRRKHGIDLKLPANQQYYARTIILARSNANRSRAVDTLTVEAARTPEVAPPQPTKDRRGKLLILISDSFGTEIKAIIKYAQDPPRYAIRTAKGEIELGGVENLIGQASMRNALAATDGHYLPTFKAPDWAAIAQSLLDATETIETGPETTDRGAIAEWLNVYLDENPVAILSAQSITNGYPFIDTEWADHIFIFLSNFREWLFRRQSEKIGPKQLGILLRKFGAVASVVAYTNKPEEGGDSDDPKQTTRSVWRVPWKRRRSNVVRKPNANGHPPDGNGRALSGADTTATADRKT